MGRPTDIQNFELIRNGGYVSNFSFWTPVGNWGIHQQAFRPIAMGDIVRNMIQECFIGGGNGYSCSIEMWSDTYISLTWHISDHDEILIPTPVPKTYTFGATPTIDGNVAFSAIRGGAPGSLWLRQIHIVGVPIGDPIFDTAEDVGVGNIPDTFAQENRDGVGDLLSLRYSTHSGGTHIYVKF